MDDPARDLLDAKLALEAELARPLYRAGVNYVAAWEQSGGNIGAHEKLGHLSVITAILTRHYARVTMVMQGRRPPKDPTLAEACRSNQHIQSLSDQAHRNAQLVIASLDRELARGMTAGPDLYDPTDDFVDDGMTKEWGLDDIEVKDTTNKKPRVTGVTAGYVGRIKTTVMETLRKWKQKIGGIVNANTNPQAEQARREDAKNKGNEPPANPPVEIVPNREANGRLIKVWVCKMDGRERDWHHNAHMQEVEVDSPFIVGGEMLMFPGDASMGASLRNLVNCRCATSYQFLADDGTRTDVHQTPHAPTRRYRKPGDTQPPVVLPTSKITLNGRTRANVFLRDKQPAVLEQTSPSTIVIRRNRRTIARATIRNGKPEITVEKGSEGLGIEDLIRNSVSHSRTMDRTPHALR